MPLAGNFTGGELPKAETPVLLAGDHDVMVGMHVEVQGNPDESLPLRMVTSGYRIFDRYQVPVASLAILTDDDPSWDRWNPWLARESKVGDEGEEESW